MSRLPNSWRGVRLATVSAGIDPDGDPHRVSLPTGWGLPAASALAALAGDEVPRPWSKLALPDAAERWIGPIDAAEPGLGDALHGMLLRREGCPDRPIWHGEAAGEAGFVLHLAAFAEPGAGPDAARLDGGAFDAALAAAAAVLRHYGGATRGVVRLAGLDGLLATVGLDYESDEAREAAAALVRRARARLRRIDPALLLAVDVAGPAEALLGVESSGFAPAFASVDAEGRLTGAAEARLAALRLSPERALALTLEGRSPLRAAGHAAHAAMHETLAPLLDRCPPAPEADRVSPDPDARPRVRRTLPPRARGFTQKVSIGGHRVFVRTAEHADGTLGEVSLALGGREGSLARGLADAVGTAMSIALQNGVPLDCFIEAFAHGRFGMGGRVEGDALIAEASSPLDYAMRALAEAYGGRRIPDPRATASHPADMPDELPLGLPRPPTPVVRGAARTLRLVGAA